MSSLIPISLKKIELNVIGNGNINKIIELFKCKLNINTVTINGKTEDGALCDYNTGTLNKPVPFVTKNPDGTNTIFIRGDPEKIMAKIKKRLKKENKVSNVTYNETTGAESTTTTNIEHFNTLPGAGIQVEGVKDADVNDLIDAATSDDPLPEKQESNFLLLIIIILIIILALVNIYLFMSQKK